MAVEDTLKSEIAETPHTVARQQAFVTFFLEEIDNKTLLKPYLQLVGDLAQGPATFRSAHTHYFHSSARQFVRDVLLAEEEWDDTSDAMLEFIANIPKNTAVVLSELCESLPGSISDNIAFLETKARELNIDGADVANVESLVWSKAKLDRQGTLTRFGAYVLSLPFQEASMRAERADTVVGLRTLYREFDFNRLTKHVDYFVERSLQESEYSRAVFAHQLSRLDAQVYRAHVETIALSVERDPKPRFIIADTLRAYEDKTDEAFAVAEKLAIEVLPAERSIHQWRNAPWSMGHGELQLDLVEWLAKYYGKRAKKALKKYKNKNYVYMVKWYFPAIVEHLGQDGADILFSGFAQKAVGKSVYGFMEHATYYQRLLQLCSQLDMSKYRDRIEDKLKKNKSEGVKALAELYFDPAPGKKDVKTPSERLSLRTATSEVVNELAVAIANGDVGTIRAIHVVLNREDEPRLAGVVVDGETRAELRPNIALWEHLPSLDEFATRHSIPPRNFSWGDSEALPLSIYLWELGKSLAELPTLLHELVDDSVLIEIDEEPLQRFIASCESSVKRQVAYQFVTNLAAREFALLCYDDEADQAFIEELACPLVRYELVDS